MQLKGEDIHLIGKRDERAIADIALSSIGWITVNSAPQNIHLRAQTPDGRGITTREPLLPFAFKYKGPRIPGTNFYKLKPLNFDGERPKNLKRFRKRQR